MLHIQGQVHVVHLPFCVCVCVCVYVCVYVCVCVCARATVSIHVTLVRPRHLLILAEEVLNTFYALQTLNPLKHEAQMKCVPLKLGLLPAPHEIQ